jgi:hypothetical protein
MCACRRAATPMLRRDHGVASSIQNFPGPKGPPFAAGQLCHATGARLVPWRQPGGWGRKSLIASTAPFRPESDVLASAAAPRPNATGTHLTARGALTARVPRGTDSDGASLTAVRLQPWGTDLRLTACVPRGADSDGAHLTAVRLPTARAGILRWNRRPQAMPGRGPRACGRGQRAAPEQATPGRARWQSPWAPGPGTWV